MSSQLTVNNSHPAALLFPLRKPNGDEMSRKGQRELSWWRCPKIRARFFFFSLTSAKILTFPPASSLQDESLGCSLKAFISAGLVNKCLPNTRCIPEAKRRISSPAILNCSKEEAQEGQVGASHSMDHDQDSYIDDIPQIVVPGSGKPAPQK